MTTTYGIYCSTNHSLAGRKNIKPEEIFGFDFVAQINEKGICCEPWPVNYTRNISVSVDHLQGVIEGVLLGNLIALLPEHVAQYYVEHERIASIDTDLIPPSTYYALRRKQLVPNDTNDQVLEIFRKAIKSTI